MKRFALLILLLSLMPRAQAQSINDKWFCFTNTVIDFSSGTPVLVNPPNSQSPPLTTSAFPGDYPGDYMGAQTSVCDSNGNLLFFVKILTAGNGGLLGNVYPAWAKIFDKNGRSLPNSDINVDWGDIRVQPLIAPHPGKPNLYFVFYSKNGGLEYSVVDMSLNNGLGAVVPSQKDILLSPWGTINGFQFMSVSGCQGIWLIARSASYDRYFSYLIDDNEIQAEPTVSNVGVLPVSDYLEGGRLVASPDGRHLAIATKKGIELYDFEKCSGKITHPRLIDSAAAFFGLCYSPDGSRLYASQVDPLPLPNSGHQGQVYQFDMLQNSPQAITASKTLIITNPSVFCVTFFGGGPISLPIGDLKLGPDGQIYMSNNVRLCDSTLPIPPATSVYQHHALHVIHNPNALGLACNPELNVLALNTPQSYSFQSGSLRRYFSANVVSPPPPPDTLPGAVFPVTVCFRDRDMLEANSEGSCYLWDDSSTRQNRMVDTNGVYWVRYFKDCSVVTDTYYVRFIPLPEFSQLNYGCPGAIIIDLKNKTGDTLRHTYRLMDSAGRTVDVQQGRPEVLFNSLDTGVYYLNITTTGGCDTTINLKLEAYPVPDIQVRPTDTTIHYGDAIRLQASGAYWYLWSPGNPLDTTVTADPLARPRQPTVFTVVGWNRYGCKDTGYVRIDLDYGLPGFVPNAFSPNGDGRNDVFKIEYLGAQKISVFEIFNRYGQQVFSAGHSNRGWDGRYRGKPCDLGTYYYLIQIVNPEGAVKTYKGEVNLIR